MDWIFENLQILFFIAAGVAFWLNSLRQAKAEAEAERERENTPVDLDEVFGPDFDFNAPPPPAKSPQQTEVFLPPPVTMSSQGAPPPPLPGQRPQANQRERREFPQGTPTPQRPQRPPSPHQSAAPETVNAELERQRNLEQRIRALRQNREGRGSGAAATQRSVVAQRAARTGAVDAEPISIDGIRSRLRSPREARRAIVLREILDTPVGMR